MEYVKDFENDLEIGRKRERELASILLSSKKPIDKIEFAPPKKFYDWDLKITSLGVETTYEVKQDFKGQYTGNVALEYEFDWKPSGISTSKSDYYVICPREWEFYFQSRPVLLSKLMEAWFKGVMWGDRNKSKMFLITPERIPEFFIRLKRQ